MSGCALRERAETDKAARSLAPFAKAALRRTPLTSLAVRAADAKNASREAALGAFDWRNLADTNAPDALDQPRFVVTSPAAATGDKFFEFEETVPAGSPGFSEGRAGSPPMYAHPRELETFTVLEGEMRAEVEGEVLTVQEGDSLSIPKGATHQFWNGHADKTLRIRIRLEPPNALESKGRPGCAYAEAFFENLSGMLRDAGGKPDPLAMMQLFAAGGMELREGPAFLWPIFKYVVPVITGYSGYLPTHDAYTWPCYDYVYRTKPDERAKYKGDDCTESKCDAFCWFEQQTDKTQQQRMAHVPKAAAAPPQDAAGASGGATMNTERAADGEL